MWTGVNCIDTNTIEVEWYRDWLLWLCGVGMNEKAKRGFYSADLTFQNKKQMHKILRPEILGS